MNCTRCAGKGIIPAYIEVKAGGTCVRCYGTGIDPGRTIDKTVTVNGIAIRLTGNNVNQLVEFNGQAVYFTDMDEARRFANSSYRSVR